MNNHSTYDLYYKLLIFCTGAITLALEVIASRIMTPYFGVSLYIWTGILSITLISLALGYYAGGWLCKRVTVQRQHYLFITLPALAAISLFISALIYPKIFLDLASLSLVGGSFIACLILLFIPLLLLSGMNPILVAILSDKSNAQDNAQQHGGSDNGAGLVFFVSTVGSVIGVLLSAFIFIPNVANYNSVLILSIALPLLTFASLWVTAISKKSKREVAVIAAIAVVLNIGLLIAAPTYLKKDEPIAFNGTHWIIEREYASLFGNTKVIRLDKTLTGEDGAEQVRHRWIYFQEGIAQNIMDDRGRSASTFTYALEYLGRVFQPGAESALVLGMGAGFVPQRLKENGIAVDVVEINPNSIDIARDYFHFDSSDIRLFEEDARTYIRHCEKRYSIIVVDLFQGDGIPDYLLTREFFHDMKQCMSTDGIAVFNTFGTPARLDASYYHILKTINSEFKTLKMLHDDETDATKMTNIYLLASPSERLHLDSRVKFKNIPPSVHQQLKRVFAKARPIDKARLENAMVLTDEHNVFSFHNADNYLRYRENLLKIVPEEMLVN